ncbi:copper chaperone PCu(A)C [Novosphingobium sp. Rr 2-17]|uniref:copper chaperone PCu(A)C n=1 Tax=Novosphingobium sp. Rr 2-17 TaxID=555793 RepID=UPI001ED97AFC|nr:copper chaperone PCu(A)C [Novosphingobium sp. Rr 2-17]
MSAANDVSPSNKEFSAMHPARKLTLGTALLGCFAMAVMLAGCGKSPEPAGSEAAPAPVETKASNGPDAKPGISASGARLVLPVIPGRPAAAYFTVRNDGGAEATLVGVHVADAGSTQMHRTQGGTMAQVDKLAIAPGGALEFAPGGLHAMVFDPGTELKAGGTSELTLTFSDGDKISIPLSIEGMGPQATGPVNVQKGAGHDMSGMEGMSGHDMTGMQH